MCIIIHIYWVVDIIPEAIINQPGYHCRIAGRLIHRSMPGVESSRSLSSSRCTTDDFTLQAASSSLRLSHELAQLLGCIVAALQPILRPKVTMIGSPSRQV